MSMQFPDGRYTKTIMPPGSDQPRNAPVPQTPQQGPGDPDLQAKQAEWDRKYAECAVINRAKGVEATGQCRRDLGPRPVAAPRVLTLEEAESNMAGVPAGTPMYNTMKNAIAERRRQMQQDADAGNAFADREDERRLKAKREAQLDADREEARGDREYGRKQRQASDSQAQNQAQNQARQSPFDNQPTEVIRRMIEERRKEDDMTDMVRGANDKYDKEREKFTQDKETAAKRLAYSPPTRPGQASPISIAPGQQQPPQGVYGDRVGPEQKRFQAQSAAQNQMSDEDIAKANAWAEQGRSLKRYHRNRDGSVGVAN